MKRIFKSNRESNRKVFKNEFFGLVYKVQDGIIIQDGGKYIFTRLS
jgi:hypothetical protein